MAKRPGLWAEIQQERARRERARQRESREFQRAQAQMVRQAARAERDGKRQAAASERERRKLYIEDRKAEAAAMAADVRARLAELDELLKAGVRDRPVVTFPSLRRTDTYPPFDPGQLSEPLPAPGMGGFRPGTAVRDREDPRRYRPP
jgi:restriction system protein